VRNPKPPQIRLVRAECVKDGLELRSHKLSTSLPDHCLPRRLQTWSAWSAELWRGGALKPASERARGKDLGPTTRSKEEVAPIVRVARSPPVDKFADLPGAAAMRLHIGPAG
jgi:hypothetical protein